MTEQSACGCEDYALTRRHALAGLAAGAATAVFSDSVTEAFRQAVFDRVDTSTNTVIVLSLRGGADSLSLLPPASDPNYPVIRPSIALTTDTAGLIPTTNDYLTLHPSFAPMLPLIRSGRMAAVPQTGMVSKSRSHFAAIEEMEDADPGSDARVGWINRLIGLDSLASPLEAASLGATVLPPSTWGSQPVLSARRARHIDLGGPGKPLWQGWRRQAVRQMYEPVRGPLGNGGRAALATTDVLQDMKSEYTPANGAVYPRGPLGDAVADTARLIKKRVGLKIVTIDHGSWDMHRNIGSMQNAEPGSARGMVTTMSQALNALFVDLGSLGEKVTVVTMTEFGRRLIENGSRGADHGAGTAMFLVGAGVRGSTSGALQVYGGSRGDYALPGRVAGNEELDLPIKVDYRNVLHEVLQKRLPANYSRAEVFPGAWDPQFQVVGCMT